MSGSETGLLTSTTRDPFGVSPQKNPATSQPVIQNMRLAFSADATAVYKPMNTATSPSYQPSSSSPASAGGVDGSAIGTMSAHVINVNGGSGAETLKRKRGRPRKYGPDGTMALTLVTPPQNATQPTQPPPFGGGFSSPTSPPPDAAGGGVALSVPSGGSASPPGVKKARGRPRGSTNKKHNIEHIGSVGFGFTPNVITVKAGEDVSSKIMSFAQHGPRAVCILSANGAISNVTLCQPATSGGSVTYEGRFEILSLSGSFLPSENWGHRSRTGGLSVSLSGPDGQVLGGGVAGLLMAATPIQVVVASFISDGQKEPKSLNYMEPFSAMARMNSAVGATGPSSPLSRGTLSESSEGGHGSPLNQNSGACNNSNPQGISSMPWK